MAGGDFVGARPEAVVVAAFAAAAVASVLWTVRLASRLDDAPRPLWLASALSFVLLLLPMALFAQREHAALLLAIPAATAIALIADGKRLNTAALLASGFAAGLVVVIKPYFAAAVVAPALWAIWKQRSLRPFVPALAAGVVAVGAYAASVLLFANAYLDVVPVIARTYVPMHDAVWKLIIGPAFYPAIALGLAALLRARRIPPLGWAWGLAAAGFYVAALVQGKNYPNHWLPQAALAMIATFAIALAGGVTAARRTAVTAALGLVGLCAMYQWTIRPDPAVAQAIRDFAPPAPKIISLSPQLTTGHPVTRNVDGVWVGSRAGLFTAAGARYVGLNDAQVREDYHSDIDSFRTSVLRHSPDVVLVGVPAKTWLMREPVIARTMSAYRPVQRIGETEIWVRRHPAR